MSGIIWQSFGINLVIMRVFGWYPPEDHKRLYKVQSFVLYLLFIIVVPVLILVHLILQEDLDLAEENYNAAYLAQTGGFITKLLPFIKNGEQIKTCINYFDAPCFEVHREKHKRIINNCVRICRRNSMAYAILLLAGVTVFNIKPLFWQDNRLPLDIWLPFNPTGLRVYHSTYLFLVIGISYAGSSMIVDPLVGGLALHAAGQLKVLKENLQHLSEYTEAEILEKSNKSDIIYRKIRQCVQHHNNILNFTKEYESCFSLVVFSQFASSVFAIGFSCLQLTMLDSLSFTAVSSVFNMILVLGEIYFYCYYGTTIFQENNSLTTAIYMGKWYEYDVKSRKALIILMERSKRPMIVTAGKLLDLSLETFTMILRRTYSLIAVLKGRY